METLTKRTIIYDRKEFSDEELLSIYKAIKTPRLIEEKMLVLLRQGKISKWFSGWGQEAISVGAALAMHEEEHILPMHRNLGVFTTRNIPFYRLFAQFQGKMSGFTKGRDRSFHFGAKAYNIVGMISHLGPQMGVADGIALACKLKNEQKATLVFTGDGGASEGDFHESVNLAAVWQLPVVFGIENNQWGLSTPSREQFRCKQFIDKGIGYGIEAVQVDGNNILKVISTLRGVLKSIRENPRPYLVEFITFRMRGHEEASGTKYYPEGLQDEWALKDPIQNFELFLKEEGLIDDAHIHKLEEEIKQHIHNDLEIAFAEEKIVPNTSTELSDVYAPLQHQIISPQSDKKLEMRFIDAISLGLKQAMERHDDLVIMGQDIAEYGGAFKITQDFYKWFGKERVRNTPIIESATLGASLGMSIKGMKSVVEMQFADFVTCGFNQIVNNLAKSHWRWGQNANVVVRMPTGGGVAAGPFHSQSNEAWFAHTPGLKVVYPAFPQEAKGLLAAAIEDPNPVMFFEHKYLYRSLKEEVNEDYFSLEIGKAKQRKEGHQVSIITYGLGVHWALEVLAKYPEISADLIDLQTLLPLDENAVYASVKKTGKAIVLHEDSVTGGFGGEIASLINEHCFEQLDAPVIRVGSLDTPIPFAADLEQNFLGSARFEEKLIQLIQY
jgi:2-oxoisovalerate dehydrogenase E1 component